MIPAWLVKTKKYWTNEKIILGLILTLTVFFYWPSLRGEFLYWDDNYQVTENPDIKELSWANTVKIFSSFYMGMYQPLSTLTYAIDWRWSPNNPLPFHLTNLGFHLLNIILVWLLFKKLKQPMGLRLLAAAFLAWQPLNVEAVAWISARSGLLANSAILGATIAYLLYLQKTQRRWFWFSFFVFVIGILSKSTVVIFPLIALAADYLTPQQKRQTLWHNLWTKIPFWLLSLFFGYLTIFGRQQAGHLASLSAWYNLFDRLILIGYSLSFYLVKFFLPFNLSPHYSYPLPINHHLAAEIYLLTSLVLLIGVALTILIIKKVLPKIIIFGLAWFFLNLILVLKIIPVGWQYATDRYNYLPSLGLFLILGYWFYNSKLKQTRFKYYFILMIVFVLLFFGFLTYEQTKLWQDKVRFLDAALSAVPDSADWYFFRGLAKQERQDYQGALDDFTAACYFGTSKSYFHESRALLLHNNLKRPNQALLSMNEAIRLTPDINYFYYERALILLDLNNKTAACADLQQAATLGWPAATEKYKLYCPL